MPKGPTIPGVTFRNGAVVRNLTAAVDVSDYNRVQLLAARRGTSMTAIMNEALKKYLSSLSTSDFEGNDDEP